MMLLAKIDGLDQPPVAVRPLLAVGLTLQCQVPGGPNRMANLACITELHAADPQDFWAAWKALGGERQGLAWESGEPFQPPGAANVDAQAADCDTPEDWL